MPPALDVRLERRVAGAKLRDAALLVGDKLLVPPPLFGRVGLGGVKLTPQRRFRLDRCVALLRFRFKTAQLRRRLLCGAVRLRLL